MIAEAISRMESKFMDSTRIESSNACLNYTEADDMETKTYNWESSDADEAYLTDFNYPEHNSYLSGGSDHEHLNQEIIFEEDEKGYSYPKAILERLLPADVFLNLESLAIKAETINQLSDLKVHAIMHCGRKTIELNWFYFFSSLLLG